jgi:hypothetical protein
MNGLLPRPVLLRPFLRLVTPYSASGRGAKKPMVMRVVTRYSADDCALDATLSVRGTGCKGSCDKRSHKK